MKAKTFVWAVLAAVLGVLGALALVLALTDPFFVVRGLDEEDTALFSNQRYEMAGLIRNQDYSAVVMGTSLVANYRASWFTEGLGKETLKITFPDGWLSEFDTALHLAYQTHPELDTVFFGLDLNILIRPDSQRDVELPMYLYNTNPFDDVQYFLNKETYIQVAKLLVNRLNGGTTTLDNAYVWDGSHEFSREHSLEVYYRLPDVSPPEPEDTYLAAAKENLAVVTGWAGRTPTWRRWSWRTVSPFRTGRRAGRRRRSWGGPSPPSCGNRRRERALPFCAGTGTRTPWRPPPPFWAGRCPRPRASCSGCGRN